MFPVAKAFSLLVTKRNGTQSFGKTTGFRKISRFPKNDINFNVIYLFLANHSAV